MQKLLIRILCLAFLFVSVGGLAVSAACSGYGSYKIGVTDAIIPFDDDTAYASLTKCSCNPVDNELMVWIHVQNYENGNYYWTPGQTTYYYSKGTDTASVERTIKEYNITYVYAKYFATCGSNAQTQFDAEYHNN